MSALRILLVLSSVASIVSASPIKDDLAGRANLLCSLENPIIQALGAQRSASAFCSSYLAVSTQTLYATATATRSTSTTTTLATGTEVDTAPTLTLTDISSVTTTTVTLTTSDDTTPTVAPARRDIDPRALPPALSRFAAPILSSACSCLSIPKPSTTTTQTVTSVISFTSTSSTFAATTTYTPLASTTTTDIETATSVSVLLKSDLLASIVAIVNNDNSYQSFCSDILDYTTPVTTVYQTATANAQTTVTTTSSRTNFVTVTVTTIPGAPAKRQAEADPTPAPLASYPADYVTSGCLLAVTSPGTSTISSTITTTTTATIVQPTTQTIQATSTATVTLVKYPVTNGNFETGSFAPWSIVQPINGAGGAWTLQPGEDAARGAWVAQLLMLNPDRTKYGSFASWISETYSTYAGHPYTLTFDYRCTQISSTSYINPQVPGATSTQLTCASANTWYQASVSFTASSTSSWVYLVGIQNGYTQAVYQFDNVVVTLNQ